MECDQLVTIDNCCTPSTCGKPATWSHEASGLALCALHHGNAVKYCIDGTWDVAGKQLPFPEGWVTVDGVDASVAASAVAPVEDVRASGLVIESGTVLPSGLVIER